MITSRQQLLLTELVDAGRYFTVSDLAERFSLSQRTIRLDLQQLEQWLQAHELELQRSHQNGISILLNDEERQRLDVALNQKLDFVANAQRIKLMAKELLKQDKVHMDKLAEEYGISRNTLLSDLNELREWFASKQLSMRRLKGYLYVEGTEFLKRSAFLYLLREEIPDEKLLQLMLVTEPARLGKYVRNPWFNPEDAIVLFELVQTLERKLRIEFTDAGYSALLLHLLMAIERLKHQHMIVTEHAGYDEIKDSIEYMMVVELLPEPIRRHFGVELPQEELAYITQHVLGAQKSYEETNKDDRFVRLASAMVNRVEQELNTPLLHSETIISGLAVHLKPALYRARFGMKHENPLLPHLKSEYGELLEKIHEIANRLIEDEGIRLDRGETGYIALHICSGLHQPVKRTVVRVAILCSSGLGTASLLTRRLSVTFPHVQIVGKFAYKQLSDITPENADFILSTIPITIPTVVPWMQISPLLNHAEISKLKVWLGEPAADAENAAYIRQANELLQLIEEYTTIIDRDGLIQALLAYFNGTNYRESLGNNLSDLLAKQSIILQAQAEDWRAAIHTGLEPLMLVQACSLQYEDKLLELLDHPKHHMLIAPGVIFPHASPEDGVWKTALSLVTLKEPIAFGARQDPVWLIITLTAMDKTTHVPALTSLLSLLNDSSFMDLLRDSTTSSEQIWKLIHTRGWS